MGQKATISNLQDNLTKSAKVKHPVKELVNVDFVGFLAIITNYKQAKTIEDLRRMAVG